MASIPTAAVTPKGIRDGDPIVLAALTERRGGAVLAYCEHVAPGVAANAAADAFARFRRDVVDSRDPLALDPEATLVRATRLAAAAHAPRPHVSSSGLLGRRGASCALIPELLAARAEGELTMGDRARLSRHLARCAQCREADERFRRAEEAYLAAPDAPPPQPVAKELMHSLMTAAPNVTPASAGNGQAVNGAEVIDEPPPPEPSEAPTLSWDVSDVEKALAAERRRGSLVTRLVAPAAIVVVAAAGALMAGGLFDEAPDPARAVQVDNPPAVTPVQPYPALTTPLPLDATPAPG
jgi:hypothetical protein